MILPDNAVNSEVLMKNGDCIKNGHVPLVPNMRKMFAMGETLEKMFAVLCKFRENVFHLRKFRENIFQPYFI